MIRLIIKSQRQASWVFCALHKGLIFEGAIIQLEFDNKKRNILDNI